jgi:hypothetical protein
MKKRDCNGNRELCEHMHKTQAEDRTSVLLAVRICAGRVVFRRADLGLSVLKSWLRPKAALSKEDTFSCIFLSRSARLFSRLDCFASKSAAAECDS